MPLSSRRCRAALALALPLVLATSAATARRGTPELPQPPAGFAWKEVRQIGAAFLVPSGWHFASEKRGGTLAYFVLPEKLDRGAGFTTGMTINVVRKLKGQAATDYARDYIAELVNRNESMDHWESTIRGMPAFGCEIKMPADGAEPAARAHYLALANPATNTLYLMWFEAPESEWSAAWTKGKTMLESFVLNEET